MPDPYISLPPQEKWKFLDAASQSLDKQAFILEKDIWLCWVLEVLFSVPGLPPMLFKGGTSLSKVYAAIDRFSEDVDVGFDYRHLGEKLDPFLPGTSRTAVNKLCDRLQLRVGQYAENAVIPSIRAAFEEVTSEPYGIRTDDSGEKIWFRYPSVCKDADTGNSYVQREVLLELGSRLIVEPFEKHTITPEVAVLSERVRFPAAKVAVMPLGKTLWEKITLMHVECNRDRVGSLPERYSRHWHDVAVLAAHPAGQAALSDRQSLAEVVRHKKVFFHSSYARYDECLAGRIRLLPDSGKLLELREDYEQMRESGILNEDALDFDTVVERVSEVEKKANLLSV